ncbi:hypothetical protein, partial [Paratractidigestivibacter sp.]|uniref:hypothetical protein n=1 Tax=Paratractidigestivibacter sp. TaxID=2847316 RepID=UPI003AB3FB62
MTYVISHTTALEAMRLADAPRLLAAAEPLDIPDAKAPTKSEADRWLGRSSMGRLLTRPVQMLVADATGSRDNEVFRSRVLRSELPAGAFRRIGTNLAVPCPELLVLQMARLATPLELVLLIEELCGTYAVQPADPSGMLQRKEPLTSRARILEFIGKLNRPPAAAKVREACSLAFDASGSPMECVSSTPRFTKQHPFVPHVSVKILHARASPWHQSFLLLQLPAHERVF